MPLPNVPSAAAADRCHLLRLRKQLLHAARNRVSSRFAARNRQQHEEGIELEFAQRTELIFNLHKGREDIVCRVCPLARRYFLAVAEDLCGRTVKACHPETITHMARNH